MRAPEQLTLADVGLPLSEATFVVVDLETTGASHDDAITEIGAVKVRGGEVIGEFASLVNPQRPIPADIRLLTGITPAMVADAPTVHSVIPAFLAFAEGAVWVAHNARFDTGFLQRACASLGYPWPSPPVIDTVAVARALLPRSEIPNVRLQTLARYFATPTTPTHRALDDARTTAEVLHALIERAGTLHVHSVEDLAGLSRRVPETVRRKAGLAANLPDGPGVYLFRDAHDQVLYVGTSRSIRRRVRTYFTAAESRRTMREMVTLATTVDAVPCPTALEARIRELRLIDQHRPPYNRRSRHPEATYWLARKVRASGAGSWSIHRARSAPQVDTATTHAPLGPFSGRDAARRALEALTLNPHSSITEAAHAALAQMRTLSDQQRYEEAASYRDCLLPLLRAQQRSMDHQSLTRCASLIAAAPLPHDAATWEVVLLRHGRLAASALWTPDQNTTLVLDALEATAPRHDCAPPIPEEAIAVGAWLQSPQVRLLRVNGTLVSDLPHPGTLLRELPT